MQFTWVLPLALSLVSAAALPAEPIAARDVSEAVPTAALIFARAPEACVPQCAGAVAIGRVACGTCGQQAPCTHYACSGGNRQVCGVNQKACYYSQ